MFTQGGQVAAETPSRLSDTLPVVISITLYDTWANIEILAK